MPPLLAGLRVLPPVFLNPQAQTFHQGQTRFFRDLRFGLPVPGHYTPSCLPGVEAGVAGMGSPPPGSTPLYTQGRAEAGQRAFGHAHFAAGNGHPQPVERAADPWRAAIQYVEDGRNRGSASSPSAGLGEVPRVLHGGLACGPVEGDNLASCFTLQDPCVTVANPPDHLDSPNPSGLHISVPLVIRRFNGSPAHSRLC